MSEIEGVVRSVNWVTNTVIQDFDSYRSSLGNPAMPNNVLWQIGGKKDKHIWINDTRENVALDFLREKLLFKPKSASQGAIVTAQLDNRGIHVGLSDLGSYSADNTVFYVGGMPVKTYERTNIADNNPLVVKLNGIVYFAVIAQILNAK